MIQAISVTGAMSFNLIYPLIMGINLGTCVTTAMVCSIGSSKDAKRTGIVHITFNVIGTIVFMILMTVIRSVGLLPELWTSVVNSGDIANFQTLFNLVTAIILVPFAGQLVNLSLHIVKPDATEAEDKADLVAPDEKLFQVPAMALAESTKAIAHMGEVAFKNLRRSCKLVENFDAGRVAVINENEDNLDSFTDTMDGYLVDLSQYVETDDDNRHINVLMQASTNFERIGDHALNITEVAENMNLEKLGFTDDAKEEYELVVEAVLEITRITVDAFQTLDVMKAKAIEPLEEVIDDIVATLKDRHIERLKQGRCTTPNGLAFVDLLTNLERVADQCSNIGLLILGKSDKAIMNNHHGYVRELHKGGEEIYNNEVKKRRQQYLSRLNSVK